MTYDGPMGQGWDFNYNRRLIVEPNGNVLCVNGLGRVDRYTLNTNGTFISPAGFYTQIRRELDGKFTESDRHGNTNVYSATNSLSIAKLASISDRNGNQMTFQYSTNAQLTNVVDTLGRSIAYSYDSWGRLTSVTDFAGRTLSFAYDSNGNLVAETSPAVTGTPNGNDFPSGKTTLYTYSSGFSLTFARLTTWGLICRELCAAKGAGRPHKFRRHPAVPRVSAPQAAGLGHTHAAGVAAADATSVVPTTRLARVPVG
jgi:YD repeat-containing protein